jgi:hypothetical protein
MKLRGLVPNFYIHVYVSDFYIPTISPWHTNRGNIYVNRSQIHECGHWETEYYNYVLEIMRARRFYFWEHINRNQTFI